MPRTRLLRTSPIARTPRVAQIEGIFDLPPSERSEEVWEVDLALPDDWQVGLIVGPSGSGKTTVARELFGEHFVTDWDWPKNKSILDGFPADMGVKDITGLLSSVGFSSPPSWLRPFDVLSNGEQFRVTMARTLAEQPDMAVVDEFTSVVDRTVAQIGSAAIARTVRKRQQRFIAVTCHYDVAEWLEPDWIYEPHLNRLQAGRSLRRPDITLSLYRVYPQAWQVFRKHHYLDTSLSNAATCFVAAWEGVPVAFTAVLHFPHPKAKNIKREHRTVCLPDFQGVGIGNVMSDTIASVYTALGFRYMSQTSHPAMIASRNKSPHWKMTKTPTWKTPKKGKTSSMKGAWLTKQRTRLVASFEYAGAPMERLEALKLMGEGAPTEPLNIHLTGKGKR